MIAHDRGLLGAVDSRVKIVWLLATLLAGLIFAQPLSLGIVLGSIAAVAVVGRVLGETIRRMRSLAAIMIVLGLIFGLTVPGRSLLYLIPAPLPNGPPLPITQEGLYLGMISILRILVFAAPLVIAVMTTNNSDLIRGLLFFRLPLDYALMIVLALNFVPIVLSEFGRIADAQKARAHSLIEKGLVGRARSLIPIFVPLTLNAVDRADTVGKVLEIRGFARRQFRAEFDALGVGSWALLALSGGLLILALASAATGRDLLAMIG
jgi:energy-coupling factor transport system permease protein